jgi:hypothetical protein
MKNKRIRMNIQISGSRDGAPWPAPGEIVELPEDEANDLIRNRSASEVKDEKSVSDRPAEPYESVGLAQGHYPDASNRTGPPLVDQVGEVTDKGITVNGDHLTENRADKRNDDEQPVVPDDARVTPPASNAETAAVEAPDNAAARTDKPKATKKS